MNAQKADWNDIHVAYQVALHGTLTAAAEALGVHHSTVLRRVNALEETLDTRLFHRHARGYVPTDAGLLLTQVAENTQSDFDRLVGQLQGVDTQLTGTLLITTVNSVMEGIVPMLAEFQTLYPQIKLEYAAESRVYRLEYGEAHVSIRPGTKPTHPDYVVQHLSRQAATLYASQGYLDRYGRMKDLSDTANHRFITTFDAFPYIPSMNWLETQVRAEQIYYRCNDFVGFLPAVKAGLGIAAINCWSASHDQTLKAVLEPPKEWQSDFWLVTHRDMHRTSKVQALTQFLKEKFKQQQPAMLSVEID